MRFQKTRSPSSAHHLRSRTFWKAVTPLRAAYASPGSTHGRIEPRGYWGNHADLDHGSASCCSSREGGRTHQVVLDRHTSARVLAFRAARRGANGVRQDLSEATASSNSTRMGRS